MSITENRLASYKATSRSFPNIPKDGMAFFRFSQSRIASASMQGKDSTRKNRRFFCWLSPLRYRFWMVTLPVVSVVIILILFWWPGLTFDWTLTDRWCLFRRVEEISPSYQCVSERAELRMGPVDIYKLKEHEAEWYERYRQMGLSASANSNHWCLEYVSGEGEIGIWIRIPEFFGR